MTDIILVQIILYVFRLAKHKKRIKMWRRRRRRRRRR